MSSLAVRKQVLTAESDINRVLLLEEWQTMEESVRTFADRAKSIGSIASAAALLVTSLAAFRRTQAAPADEKPSWWQTLLKGAGLISTVWLAFSAKGHDQENQESKSRA